MTTRFDIYRKRSDDVDFVRIAESVEGNRYVDTAPLIEGDTYTYKVVAVRGSAVRESNQKEVLIGKSLAIS